MRTIVYYGEDGSAALKRVSHLRALNGDDAAQAMAAIGYVGERIKADEIEFMPDVQGWHKDRIVAAFERQKHADKIAAEREAERRAGLSPLKQIDEDSFRRSMTARFTGEAVQATVPVTVGSLDHDGDGKPGGSLDSEHDGLNGLRAEAERLGVKVDKRWGEKRLNDEIAKAHG